MRGRFLILLLITIFFQINAQQWVQLNAPSGARNDGMYFLTPELGWIANGNGSVWKTTDGGLTWAQKLQTTHYFRSIFFADSLRGWAGALSGPELLYETFDGGETWTVVNNLPPDAPTGACGIWGQGNSIYVSGRYSGPARMLKSNNGGASWQALDLSAHAGRLIDCYFFTPDSGFIVGGTADDSASTPVVLFTGDGGASWQARYTGTQAWSYCWKIMFPSPHFGVVSIENGNSASFLKTQDGGTTWQKFDIPTTRRIQGIGFLTEDLGWVGGWSTSSITTDGGHTWQNTGGLIHRANRLQVFGDTLMYASGYGVFKYTRNATAIANIEPVLPASPFLLKNYPNPFNPATMIEYQLEKSADVLVRVYDYLGQQIRVLVNTRQPAGRQQAQWDGKNAQGQPVSSGQYIYRVDAYGKAESHIMTLIR